jgi:hypothetical protein
MPRASRTVAPKRRSGESTSFDTRDLEQRSFAIPHPHRFSARLPPMQRLATRISRSGSLSDTKSLIFATTILCNSPAWGRRHHDP